MVFNVNNNNCCFNLLLIIINNNNNNNSNNNYVIKCKKKVLLLLFLLLLFLSNNNNNNVNASSSSSSDNNNNKLEIKFETKMFTTLSEFTYSSSYSSLSNILENINQSDWNTSFYFDDTTDLNNNNNNNNNKNFLNNFQFTPDNFFIGLILFLIVILTIFGNIFVLLAIFIDFHLRSPTHFLMGSLALADLLLGTTVLPFSSVQQLFNYWPFGDIFCEIWLTTDVLCCTASIYLVLAISIDRYIGVTRPLRYNLIMTKGRVYIIILLVWILSLLVSLAPFTGLKNPRDATKETCEVNDTTAYAIFSASLSFYIPLVIILIVYYRIFKEARRQSKFLKTGRKTSKLDNSENSVTLRVHIGPSNSKKNSFSNTFYANKNCDSSPRPSLNLNTNKYLKEENNNRKLSRTTYNNHLNDHSEPSLLSNGKHAPRKKSSATFFAPNNSGQFTLSGKLAKFKREQKAAKTLAIVVGAFIGCWMPFFIILVIGAFYKQVFMVFDGKLFKVFFWLGYCNSTMNPFIYAFSSREFRRAYKGILHCNLYYGSYVSYTKTFCNSHSSTMLNENHHHVAFKSSNSSSHGYHSTGGVNGALRKLSTPINNITYQIQKSPSSHSDSNINTITATNIISNTINTTTATAGSEDTISNNHDTVNNTINN